MGSPVHLEEFAKVQQAALVHIVLLHDVEELLVAERLPQAPKELLQLGGPCTRGRAPDIRRIRGFRVFALSSKMIFPRFPTSGAHGVGVMDTVIHAPGREAIHTAPIIAHERSVALTDIRRLQRVQESIHTQQPIACGVGGAECRLVLLQLAFQ